MFCRIIFSTLSCAHPVAFIDGHSNDGSFTRTEERCAFTSAKTYRSLRSTSSIRTQSRRACEEEPLWPISAASAISGVKMSVARALFNGTALRMAAFLPERDYGCPSGTAEGKVRTIFPVLLPMVVFQQVARQLPGEYHFFGKFFPQLRGLK